MEETRVEKFKSYREEIQSSFGDDMTSKKKISDRISKFINEENMHNTSSISFDEIIDAYEIYEKKETDNFSPLKGKKTISTSYIVISTIICVILLGLLIFVGLLAFGGLYI